MIHPHVFGVAPLLEAYWPLPIELPQVKYEIEVKPPKTE